MPCSVLCSRFSILVLLFNSFVLYPKLPNDGYRIHCVCNLGRFPCTLLLSSCSSASFRCVVFHFSIYSFRRLFVLNVVAFLFLLVLVQLESISVLIGVHELHKIRFIPFDFGCFQGIFIIFYHHRLGSLSLRFAFPISFEYVNIILI